MRLLRRLLAVLVMAAFDMGALIAGYLLAYLLRLTILTDLLPHLAVPMGFGSFAERFYLLAAYLVVFAYEGLYGRRLVLWEEVRRILRGLALSTVLVIMALYVTRGWILSRSVVLLALVLLVPLLPLARTAAKRLVIRLGLWSKSVVIVGRDRNAELLKTELARNWRLGYRAVGSVEPEALVQPDSPGARALLDRFRAESFVLSDASVGRSLMGQLIRTRDAPGEEVIVLLDGATLQTIGVEVEQLESVLLMKYRYNLLQPVNFLLKRGLDVVLSLVLIVLLLPLLGLLALIVRFGSRGPVAFAQERIGRDRRPFRCLKFRTMWQDADARLEKLLAEDPARKAEWLEYSRITDDPRITREGRLLRRFSLDELLQLFNVLKGEMSLVGPRPYMPREADKIGDYLEIITRVRPGITGPFQTSGRKELTFEQRLMLDEHYVKNWSLWMDLVFLMRTFRVVLSGTGAL
jgi:undecaprenyl-phosphate galactose phosphotransferase